MWKVCPALVLQKVLKGQKECFFYSSFSFLRIKVASFGIKIYEWQKWSRVREHQLLVTCFVDLTLVGIDYLFFNSPNNFKLNKLYFKCILLISRDLVRISLFINSSNLVYWYVYWTSKTYNTLIYMSSINFSFNF